MVRAEIKRLSESDTKKTEDCIFSIGTPAHIDVLAVRRTCHDTTGKNVIYEIREFNSAPSLIF